MKLGRDFGDRLEVLVGLSGEERVVTNPDDSLKEGETVRIAPEQGRDRGKPSRFLSALRSGRFPCRAGNLTEGPPCI